MRSVAKAIVFKSVERLVTDQPWYLGGYRANVVAYAIAKLAHDLEQRQESINFDRIWRAQEISPRSADSLTISAEAVHDVIVDPPEGMRNVTEWAKQQACWSRVARLELDWPETLELELVSSRRAQGCEANRGQGPADVERNPSSADCGRNRTRTLE